MDYKDFIEAKIYFDPSPDEKDGFASADIFPDCPLSDIYIPRTIQTSIELEWDDFDEFKLKPNIEYTINTLVICLCCKDSVVHTIHVPDTIEYIYIDEDSRTEDRRNKRIIVSSEWCKFDVDPNNPNYCSINGSLYNKDCSTLIHYYIGDEPSVCIIPDTVNHVEPNAFYGWFFKFDLFETSSEMTTLPSGMFEHMEIKELILKGEITEINSETIPYPNQITIIRVNNFISKIKIDDNVLSSFSNNKNGHVILGKKPVLVKGTIAKNELLLSQSVSPREAISKGQDFKPISLFFMPSSDSELDESPNRVTIMNYDTVITIEPQKIEAYEPNVEGTKICIGEGRGIVVFEPFEEVRQSITKLFSCQ